MANACDLQSENSPPDVSIEQVSMKVVQDSYVLNTSRNRKTSFIIPVTLWVSGKTVHAEALVDSGATTNFINSTFVKKHNLVTYKVATPQNIINADGTSNKNGQITDYVRALMQIGAHKSTHYLFVTNLGNKDIMVGYMYLWKHNPEIDFTKGEWKFTRCPDTCADRARKITPIDAESDDLHNSYSYGTSLDEIGYEDPRNPYITWVENQKQDPCIAAQIKIVEAMFIDKEFDDDFNDSQDWKPHVPAWAQAYGDVFSKKKSECMPT